MNVKGFFKWSGLWFLVAGIAAYAAAFALTSFPGGDFKERLMQLPWLIQVHALGGAIALVLGLVQFQRVRNTFPDDVHRWTGRFYAFAVLSSSLAGIALAVRSDTGIVAQLGFGALGISWLVTLAFAIVQIRSGNTAQHKYYMWLNYALTWAAVSLRLEMPFLIAFFGFELGYTMVAWLCWVPNLAFALWWAARKSRQVGNAV